MRYAPIMNARANSPPRHCGLIVGSKKPPLIRVGADHLVIAKDVRPRLVIVWCVHQFPSRSVVHPHVVFDRASGIGVLRSRSGQRLCLSTEVACPQESEREDEQNEDENEPRHGLVQFILGDAGPDQHQGQHHEKECQHIAPEVIAQ